MFILDIDKLKKVYEDTIYVTNKLSPKSGVKKEIMQKSIDNMKSNINHLNTYIIDDIFANNGDKTGEVHTNIVTGETEFYILIDA